MNPKQSSDFTILVDTDAINRASDLAREIFRDWNWTEAGDSIHITTALKLLHVSFDVTREILPPLALAVMFFGGDMPGSLVAKLRNKTQTRDTLFELWCLGILAQNHRVEYEPKLSNGKTPDMCVLGRHRIYVECKSHHLIDSDYSARFQNVAALIREQVDKSPVQKNAWSQGLRMEVQPKGVPTRKHMAGLRNAMLTMKFEDFATRDDLLPGFRISFVARDRRVVDKHMFRIGTILVGTEPTELSDRNQHLLIYGWPGLQNQKQRCERNLLRSARKQLEGIPADAVGMVCIETFSLDGFVSDLNKLIEMEQFRRVPLVWMNPHRKSRLIYRDDSADLVKDLLPTPAAAPLV